MKKIVLAILSLLCTATMMAGLASCDMLGGGGGTGSTPSDSSSSAPAKVSYSLDSTGFNKVVKYKGALSYEGLTLKGNDGKSVKVTEAMISGGKDTSSVGNKTLKITYGGENFEVNYTVKYEVKFMADGKAVGAPQYVLSASEIVKPGDPQKAGFEFKGWTPDTAATLTDNVTFAAQFEGVEQTAEIDLSIGEGIFEMAYMDFSFIEVSITTTAPNVTWSATVDNKNISIEEGQDSIAIDSLKSGVSTITVTATDGKGTVVEKSRTVVVKPHNFMINKLQLGDDDIEGVRTIGRTDANGAQSQIALSLELGDAESIGEGLRENIVWKSDNSKVVVDNNGVLTLKEGSGAEMVKLTAEYTVNGKVYETSTTYEVRCVFDGVNVSTYEDLWTVSQADKVVVLNGNIDFPKSVNDIKYEYMHTTYDDTFYENLAGKKDPDTARIITLLQFRNDLYGNGYQINAHNATLGLLDATGKPRDTALFKGPLNFVAMSENGEASAISVKGQDNVCFALFEGVTVNNIELRGCDLTEDQNGYDLTDLNYAGTTVEVFGDDVTIEYSRITNGRTVLRIFGDEKDANKEIYVNIKNSVLSGAREFILRMGSNAFVPGTDANVSPYLGKDNATTKAYLTKKTYNTMTSAEQEAYDKQYIKTFVNVRNSIFKDAGIFAIGIDSHFSGEALHKGHAILGAENSKNWKNLAKTSYGAKLTFEGKVHMYNWKLLEDIDSSTLIEILEVSSFKEKLDFNVKEMVQLVANKEEFAEIVVDIDGKDYVHAGIAFFGGGKNYGVFKNSETSEILSSFNVALADVNKEFLTAAAGNEDFYFMLCTEKSTFTPQEQDRLLNSNEGYSCLTDK